MKSTQILVFIVGIVLFGDCSSSQEVPAKKTIPEIDKEEVPAPAKPAPLPTPKKK